MTDTGVTITGLNRVTNPKQNKGGSTVLAHFDCVARGIELRGCAFARTPANGLTVWPPKIETADGLRRAVVIEDNSLRAQMTHAAQEAYRALGGADGEWMPRSGDVSQQEKNRAEYHARIERKKVQADPAETAGVTRFLGGEAQ
jgi:hypothetical protein